MEYQQIRNVVSDHFNSLLDRHTQHQALHGQLPELDRMALRNSHDFAVQAIKDKDYSYVATDSTMARLIDNYALPIKPETKDYDLLRAEFLKAMRDYCTTALKQDNDLSGYDFASTPTAAASKQKVRRLSDAITEYCEEKLRLKHWDPKSAKGYRKQFDLLLRLTGDDASLHLSSDVASDVKATLLRLPSNMNKKAAYKDRSIAELVVMNLPESERLNVVTVAKYMRTYSSFFDWAVAKKRTSENNFSAFVDNVKQALTPRDDFSEEEAQRILAEVMTTKKPHHKWGVLIAFYTGARLNEIAQLDTNDIKQVDDVWCFNFTDEGENKRLKNKSSKRAVPVHSRLIELGFLQFVQHAGKGRLFSALTFHTQNGYGRNLGRWFNESLLRNQLGITQPTQTFHSIRHTVAQQLRNKKVPEATLKDILGHAHAGVTMTVYATHLDKRVMQEAIETLHYTQS